MPNSNEMKTTETPPIPATPMPNATTLTQQIGAAMEGLERAARDAREQLKEVPEDPAATVHYVEACLMMAEPSVALHHVDRRPILAEGAYVALAEALVAARTALAEGAPALRHLADVVAGRRARLEVLGDDADDPMEKQVAHAQLSHGRLHRLVAQVDPYFPVAQERALQLAVAVATVLRRRQVGTLRVDLERLRAATAARRQQPDPAVADAAAVAGRLAERLGRRVHLPTISWPKSADPFAAPTLVDPEEK